MAEPGNLGTLGPPRLTGGSDAELIRGVLHWLSRFYSGATNRDGQVREDLGRLQQEIDDIVARQKVYAAVFSDIAGLGFINQTISNPPTQAQVAAIQDKVNQIIQLTHAVPPPEI